MQAGRNDPCPCGSGKKFKKCCLEEKIETGSMLWRQLGLIHDDFAKRLTEYGTKVFGPFAIEEAWDEFWVWENKDAFSLDDRVQIQLFMPFFLYNWEPDTDTETFDSAPENTSIAADYLKQRGGYLTVLERRFLEESIQTPFSFHDVLEVKPGQGFVLKDIFLGTEVEVTERLGSKNAQVGDIVYGKVIQIDSVGMLCGTGWVMIPPAHKQIFLELRKELREDCKSLGVELTKKLLGEHDLELREIFLDFQEALLSPPKLCNTDGEEFSFHQITYVIDSTPLAFDSTPLAFDKLKELSLFETEEEMLSEAERDPDGKLTKVTIVWHKRGNAQHASWDNTVMGRLMIHGQILTIEVNSEKRAKRIRKEVEKRLKGHATYKNTVLQSPESMMREKEANRDPMQETKRNQEQEEMMSHPEIQAQLKKMTEKHWETWFQKKIPALGGKTPLQAAKDPDGREMLEALLIDYERSDARSTQLFKPDFSQMRKRLGLKASPYESQDSR